MSVNLTNFVMIGAAIDEDQFYEMMDKGGDHEEWLENIGSKYYAGSYYYPGVGHKNNLSLIYPMMSGKTVYVGVVLYKSDEFGDIRAYERPDKKMWTPSKVSKLIFSEFSFWAKCEVLAVAHYT